MKEAPNFRESPDMLFQMRTSTTNQIREIIASPNRDKLISIFMENTFMGADLGSRYETVMISTKRLLNTRDSILNLCEMFKIDFEEVMFASCVCEIFKTTEIHISNLIEVPISKLREIGDLDYIGTSHGIPSYTDKESTDLGFISLVQENINNLQLDNLVPKEAKVIYDTSKKAGTGSRYMDQAIVGTKHESNSDFALECVIAAFIHERRHLIHGQALGLLLELDASYDEIIEMPKRNTPLAADYVRAECERLSRVMNKVRDVKEGKIMTLPDHNIITYRNRNNIAIQKKYFNTH